VVQISKPKDMGIVSNCNAIDCIHNQKQQCTAGGLSIAFVDDLAQCEIYASNTNEAKSPSDGAGLGDVYRCDAIQCIHNHSQICMINTITVAFLNGVAKCDTYTTESKT